ncbi:alpha/beta hydrolase [Roseovarius sp. MMSF_3281]|uniref:alpha/beta hydrolase n=1 Tax=Roseovarius sp. MMSF_3281 TaxID=3046694 RepID=UPI00273D081A|nr:alpha/beta hydrolase fold domain-containing protein [Roseovarius sp. MMSF_3281]
MPDTVYEYQGGRQIIERRGQNENGPLFICFHGGGFGGGKPDQLSPLVETLSPLACRFALPEYRMTMPEPLEAVMERGQLAVSKILERHRTGPVVLCAFSAGAPLAFWAQDLAKGRLKGMVFVSPVVDLGPKGFCNRAMRGKPRPDLSPLHALSQQLKSLLAPVFLVQGGKDETTPLARAKLFMDFAKKSQPDSQLLVRPNAGHRLVKNELQLKIIYPEVKNFLTEHLARP